MSARRPPRYVALIPAAGSGSRMASEMPKQYLPLGAKPMIQHSIEAVLSDRRVERVYVIVSANDERWRVLDRLPASVEFVAVGGATRAASVCAGLEAIAARTHDDDRVLVHDAARPCLQANDLRRLIDEAGELDDGGLLAAPLADTLKRGDEQQRSLVTLERANLWRAQTPQLFRFASLRAALSVPHAARFTDEAAAMEYAGHAPLLVAGAASNLKVTSVGDLALARAVLAEQGRL